MKNKNIVINIGDLILYCPADMKKEHHDVGIIYNIFEVFEKKFNKKIKMYDIFWSRSKDYDQFSETTIQHRLKIKIKDKYIMKIISHNEQEKAKTPL